MKLFSIFSGTVKAITEAPDPVFSQKMMGDGYCIEPTEIGVVDVLSPVDGEIVTIFPTNHAIGIKSHEALEIIVHIGMDTVILDGEGFSNPVKVGDKVSVGDRLVTVDFAKIKDKVPSLITPVVVTNLDGKTVELTNLGNIEKQSQVGQVI